jgi:hypothetical protein
MLWVLAAILFAFWVIALALKVTTGLIHIALVAAAIFFVFGFFRAGRHQRAGV